jgi:CheY-like chemotaxis protein/sugar-specific transcriptional regulator TrmB
MNRASPSILIVDDEIGTRESLSAILQSEGYVTASVASAKEAVEKAKSRFFDLVLLDIRLPDTDGTQLLAHFQKVAPETIKIVITGYPSIENAAQALNIGADSYLTKPLDPDSLLKTMRDKLQEREQNEKITAKKLADWVRLRVLKTQSSDFQRFLEKTAKELALFGVTNTQAKIYIVLDVLGVASASEIASLSEVRREEVYRVLPELEKLGLVARRLETPRRFLAVEVKMALETLIKAKRKTMEKEIINLRQKKVELIAQLKATARLKTEEEDSSIEVFSDSIGVLAKLVQMIKKAKCRIMLVSSLDNVGMELVRKIEKTIKMNKNQINTQIVTDNSWLNETRTSKLMRSKIADKQIELKHLERLPFNLLIVDEEEAIWGEFQPRNASSKTFLTKNQTQISLLKMAFNNLWMQSQKVDENVNLFVGENKTSATSEGERGAHI